MFGQRQNAISIEASLFDPPESHNIMQTFKKAKHKSNECDITRSPGNIRFLRLQILVTRVLPLATLRM
jgi:hypothetical protein